MQTNKRLFPCLILSVITFLLAGCPALQEAFQQPFQQPAEVVLKPESTKHDNISMSKRFQDTAPKSQTAVDSAIELAKRHTILSEENSVLKQKYHELTAKNRQLKDQIAVLEPELKQTEKELTEANNLLIEMRIELNNWKTDILGFRNEIRDADKTQLQALLRILEVLGGEVKLAPGQAEENDVSQQQNQSSTIVSPNRQSKPG